ncbi:hypothetical protein KC19_1G260900 [Ceratodon purpureus]|uniref:Secreted protein n=1 Tax=Ceratodon purpureus TaxID=3225 RepID=A0A8T0J9X1_CERPU|nr:hypothetical protein KC19_1G260900 [Ceratodon purpureus]
MIMVVMFLQTIMLQDFCITLGLMPSITRIVYHSDLHIKYMHAHLQSPKKIERARHLTAEGCTGSDRTTAFP